MTERPAPQIDEIEDRRMDELLGELRLVFPGVQILLAFLLILPFQPNFGDLTEFGRTLYYLTLLAAAASAVCLLAPTAAHRLRFGQRDRPWIIQRSHRLAIAGIALLGGATAGAILLITDFLYDGPVVWVLGTLAAIGIFGVWFGMPLLRGRD